MNDKGRALRRRMLNPWTFRAFLWGKLPLAAFSGMSLERFDDTACVVRLPGGWRTQNPFQSTYFAAQMMAAEMSTGAPAFVLVGSAPASVAMLVRDVRGTFDKKIAGPSTFTFEDLPAMEALIARVSASDEAETFVARSTARTADGAIASEFQVTWSFKRRS